MSGSQDISSNKTSIAEHNQLDCVQAVPETPPLSIGHLFILMSLTAVTFSLNTQSIDSASFGASANDVVWQVFHSFYIGLAVSGLAFLALLWFRTRNILYHPGHWIILILACPIAFALIFAFVNFAWDQRFIYALPDWFGYAQIFVPRVFAIAISVWAAAWSRSWWQWFFASWVVASGISVLTSIVMFSMSGRWSPTIPHWVSQVLTVFGWANVVVVLLTSALLIGSVVADVRHKTKRDWLHKYGLFMLIMNAAGFLFAYVLFWFGQ